MIEVPENAVILARRPLGVILREENPETGDIHIIKILVPPVTLPRPVFNSLLGNMKKESETIQKLKSRRILKPEEIKSDKSRVLIRFQDPSLSSLAGYLKRESPLEGKKIMTLLKKIIWIFDRLKKNGIKRYQVDPALFPLDEKSAEPKYLDTAFFNPSKFPELFAMGYLDGPPQFVAPEVLAGNPPSQKADMFFTASIARLLVKGKPPYPDSSPVAAAAFSISNPAPAIDLPDREKSAELDELFSKAMNADPEKRLVSRDEFMNRLEEIV